MHKRIIFILACAFALVATLLVPTSIAQATDGSNQTPCVPAEAYTETTDWVLVSPGDGWYETDSRVVVDKEAYDDPSTFEKVFYVLRGWDKDEAPGIDSPGWKSNSGNHNGHPDPGANTPYTTGNDDPENPKSRNWFYYALIEIPGEHHEAETHEEFKFSFDHDAVTCDPEVNPCPKGDFNGDLPGCGIREDEECKGRPLVGGPCAPLPEPEEPPVVNEPKITTESVCVGDALVTKTFKDGVTIKTDTEAGAARCAVGSDEGPAEPVQEEGF